MSAALDVRDLAFAYPDGTQVLFGVNLRVDPGERVAVIGPNGSGKTTLLLHLNGILGAVAGGTGSGTVEVGGERLTRDTVVSIRRRVGVVFQDPDDQLFMPTVERDVGFGPANLGLPAGDVAARVERALSDVGMNASAGVVPQHLSFGQRRRVAIAGVLAMDPDVLVLDEPSSNLDPAARSALVEIIERLGLATLIVTHDLPLAAQVCSRSLVLDGGRIVAEGATEDVLSDDVLLRAHRLELPYGFVLPRR